MMFSTLPVPLIYNVISFLQYTSNIRTVQCTNRRLHNIVTVMLTNSHSPENWVSHFLITSPAISSNNVKISVSNVVPVTPRFVFVTLTETGGVVPLPFSLHLCSSSLCHPLDLTEIPDGFLATVENVTVVDTSRLVHNTTLTSVGSNVCFAAQDLTEFDMSGLRFVTSIGMNFLSQCWGLRRFSAPPSSKCRELGISFLSDCYTLESVDLSGFQELQFLPTYFCAHNSLLHSVGCCGGVSLPCLTRIDDEAFAECVSLKNFDFAPFVSLQSIGTSVFENCEALEAVEDTASSLSSRLRSIESSFLSGCVNLHTFTLPRTSFGSLRTIGDNFLADCCSLDSFHTAGMEGVVAIGNGFLDGCTGMTRIDLRCLTSLVVQGEWTLHNTLPDPSVVRYLGEESDADEENEEEY
eukprot:PhM_4_TR18440/c0_g1_i3/m.72860